MDKEIPTDVIQPLDEKQNGILNKNLTKYGDINAAD